MAEANKDERTLVMKSETGEDVTYQVSDMNDEAKLLYTKIEILSKESQTIKTNAEFGLEKNDILQKHYLEVLKPLLDSDESETEEVEDAETAEESDDK